MGIFIPAYEDDCAPNVREMNREYCQLYTPPSGKIVDMGAGKGLLTHFLINLGFHVSALDMEPMTDENFRGAHCSSCDLNQGIPLPDASHDTVISQDVVHQLENPWFIFREVSRVLKPNGVFILSTPNMNHFFVRLYEFVKCETPHFLERHYRLAHQISPLPLWSVRRMAEAAGFHNEVTTYNMNYLPVVRLKLPGRTRRLGHTLMLVYRKN